MKNTKFRRRALVSSIAMLLVALVALGSATFAWFTSADTANASGMVFETTTSAGILAKTVSGGDAGEGYVMNAHFNCEAVAGTPVTYRTKENDPVVLNPASYIQNCHEANAAESIAMVRDAAFGTTKSNDPNHFIGTADAAVTSGTAWSEKVWVKTTDTTRTVTVTATLTRNSSLTSGTINYNVADAIRILVVSDTGKVLVHTGLAGSNSNKNLTANDGTTLRSAALSNSAYSIVSSGTMSVSSAEDTNYVMVYVYLDGEDQYVKTNGVSAATLLDGITVNFAMGAPVA